MKHHWLNREIILSPYLRLCLSEREYLAEFQRLKIPHPWSAWVNEGSTATAHFLNNGKSGKRLAVVCLKDAPGDFADQIAILAHEAVHVAYDIPDRMYPGMKYDEELIATAVQLITARLVEDWMKRRKVKTP